LSFSRCRFLGFCDFPDSFSGTPHIYFYHCFLTENLFFPNTQSLELPKHIGGLSDRGTALLLISGMRLFCMEQKFCTLCGAALGEGVRFCESCGAPVELADTVPGPQPARAAVQPEAPLSPATTPPAALHGKIPARIIAGIVIILVIVAAVVIVVLPKMSGSLVIPGIAIPTPSPTMTVATTLPTPVPTTIIPTPTPDPFPNALSLRDLFPFGSGRLGSEATVYRYWINDTYEWHNDMDNKYYVQKPKKGYKFLFVFVHLTNLGDTRVWFPPSSSIAVHYNGEIYTRDESHKLADKSGDTKDTAVEVREVQFFSKLNNDEYAEDFGYSHGAQLGYLYPGESQSIDGYIIYQVPQSLTPEKTYVEIAFNAQDRAVWKLA
jgi:hypothetical protein